MRFLAITIFTTLLATTTQAAGAPTPVQITFIGAADGEYVETIPVSDTWVSISNPLSVSHITGADGANCIFWGIDGGLTLTYGAGTVDVGPPQTQVGATCAES